MKDNTIIIKGEESYALLDTGSGLKLEQFGGVLLARPDPQAIWDKKMPESSWLAAAAAYTRKGKEGVWHIRTGTPESWNMQYGDLTFLIKPTSFKHTGLFPEQIAHWDWSRSLITHSKRPIAVLNLFGYTGGASLAAAQAGAHVTHVDASKVAVAWAKENAKLSGLTEAPIRWIIDDVFAFVKREIKRGKRYDAIIMDPPAFGRGPKGELWNIETGLQGLVYECEQLLSERPLFVLMSGYAAGFSHHSFENILSVVTEKRGGSVMSGEIGISEQRTARVLSCGMYARWVA